MSVEDPDPVPNDPPRRMNDDLPGKEPNEPDIVVAEDELDGEAGSKKSPKEVEDHGTQGRRRSHDGVFRVARDHDRSGRGLLDRPKDLLSEAFAAGLGRPRGSLRTSNEPEMHVGEEKGRLR